MIVRLLIFAGLLALVPGALAKAADTARPMRWEPAAFLSSIRRRRLGSAASSSPPRFR